MTDRYSLKQLKKLLPQAMLLSVIAFFAAPSLGAASAARSAGIALEHKVSDWLGGAKVNIGIKGEKLEYVGNPNSLNRCDRVIFTLDIRSFMYDGKVKKASLTYQNNPMGTLKDNEIGLELFSSGRSKLRPEDLIAGDVAEICTYHVTPQSLNLTKIDITEHVNKALAIGDGFITFRIRNITTESRGNPGSQAEGVIVPRDSVKLIITPRNAD